MLKEENTQEQINITARLGSQPKKFLVNHKIRRVVIKELASIYPKVFSANAALPLKKNVHADILLDNKFKSSELYLKIALQLYEGTKRYLKSIIKHKKRYDIKGEFVEEITQLEIAFAEKLLEKKNDTNVSKKKNAKNNKKRNKQRNGVFLKHNQGPVIVIKKRRSKK